MNAALVAKQKLHGWVVTSSNYSNLFAFFPHDVVAAILWRSFPTQAEAEAFILQIEVGR